ncbi:hypothetical protein C1645_789028 [Glomus cerebriforme]|uniref:Transmembrane protein n=1 Tax=Glomus cerebriforme TaxID=658196 RepID=A0A397S6U8_9GLOM|nr:hypothetical protein C1645_789028 [Glomus cerebriforme]
MVTFGLQQTHLNISSFNTSTHYSFYIECYKKYRLILYHVLCIFLTQFLYSKLNLVVFNFFSLQNVIIDDLNIELNDV